MFHGKIWFEKGTTIKDIRDNISPCLDIVIGKDEEREQQLKIEKLSFELK